MLSLKTAIVTIGGIALGAFSCGSSNTRKPEQALAVATISEPVDPLAVTTDKVLCAFGEFGEQQLVYIHVGGLNKVETTIDENMGYNFAWSCGSKSRRISGNGVPNHDVSGGRFASKISPKKISQKIPINPALKGSVTRVKEPGYALDSIKFDSGTAGTCPDSAATDRDCNYGQGSDTWSMVATPGNVSPWKFDFGVDESNARVQPSGHYRYHGIPVKLVEKLNPKSETSMTLVGWATDGFPMYSVQGHADANDLTSPIVEVKSSYRTIASSPANRPLASDFPLGHFSQDWEYVEGSGDLDECNGRFGATLEFPGGIYHYYLTKTYPFVQHCIKGTTTARRSSGGPGGRGGRDGHRAGGVAGPRP